MAKSRKTEAGSSPKKPAASKKTRASGLGRGLSALLQDEATADIGQTRRSGSRDIPIGSLRANSYQPRTIFDDSALKELADSIREHGIMQPILVRPTPGKTDEFEIIAGERRWRAAQKAQLHQVPVVIRTMSDQEALELALIENIQREDLSPIEEAKGYRQLMDDFDHRQEDIAQTVGKSRSHIANLLRLLSLPRAVQDMISGGELSAGHARALVTTDDPLQLAKIIIAGGLSVRAAEALAQEHSAARKSSPAKAKAGKDADTRMLEKQVSNQIGLMVSIDHKGAKGGKVIIKYKSLEQLDELVDQLSH